MMALDLEFGNALDVAPLLIGQDRRVAAQTISERHYTRSVPSGKSHYFVYGDALVVFSIPANKNIGVFLLGYDGAVWELSRLWAPDGHERNLLTTAIKHAIRSLRIVEPDLEALVSYADPNAGHTGGVYRAASWIFHGQSDESRAYRSETGEIKARRAFHSGKRGMRKDEIESLGYTQTKELGKLRFVKPITHRAKHQCQRSARNVAGSSRSGSPSQKPASSSRSAQDGQNPSYPSESVNDSVHSLQITHTTASMSMPPSTHATRQIRTTSDTETPSLAARACAAVQISSDIRTARSGVGLGTEAHFGVQRLDGVDVAGGHEGLRLLVELGNASGARNTFRVDSGHALSVLGGAVLEMRGGVHRPANAGVLVGEVPLAGLRLLPDDGGGAACAAGCGPVCVAHVPNPTQMYIQTQVGAA